MPISNFPKGFAQGVTIRGMPLQVAHPGKVFWVNNSTVLPPGGIGGSDGNDGTYLRPFSTLDYAIGRCTAGRGDIIMVMPGHAENIASAAAIALDVSGVAIVGLGQGELRPIFSLITATTATFKITGANTTLRNLVFKCNIASLATELQIQALDVTISECEFREGSASGLGFIEVGSGDNDSDRLHIEQCKFYSTGSNQDHFIEILKDMIQIRILDCEGTGDCDEGCIAIPAGGNACLDLQIKGGTYRNTQTNIAAISINGTTCTGVIKDVLLITDTQASALDNGSLATDNVKWADETDQVSSTVVLAPSDSVSNAIGVDDADNAFASTNVVADRDGSVLERLEHILDCIVDDETTNALGVNDADNAFDSTNVVANRDGSILERTEYLYDLLVDDETTNALGVNDADNAFVSSSVVANRDGSLLERSEFLMNHVTQGLAVASVDLSAASPRTIYTITGGPILIHFLGIKITAACSANAALVNFNSVPTVGSPTVISKVACAPDLQSAAAGDWFAIGGGSAEVAIKYATGTTLPDIQSGTSGGIIVDAGTITVVMSTDNLTTGTATAYMAFTPLSAGVTVA